MLAAIYTRVSSEEQVKGYSLAEQERACREKAQELGAAHVVMYSDEGITGSLIERPGLTQLRDAISRKELGVLICRDPDRLARNLAHQLIIADECEKNGTELIFTGWDWQKTPEGQLFFAIRGAVSQYEREKIRERMKRGKMQKARSGLEPNRINIFGYQYNETGQALLEDREAGIVRDIFRWFISEDISLTALAYRLEKLGIPTPGGQKRWYKQTVRYILSNPTYMGKHIFNKRNDSGIKNNKYAKEKARRIFRVESEWIEIPYPEIIDPKTFGQAQEKLSRCKRLWSGDPKYAYLLSGLLRCGKCGNTMIGMRTNYRKPHQPDCIVYSCRREKGGMCCKPNRYIKGTPLELTVWEHVIGWINQPDKIIEHIKDIHDHTVPLDERINHLTKELQTVEKGRKNILDVLASGMTNLDDKIKQVLKELTDREQNIRRHIKMLQMEKYRQVSHNDIKNIALASKILNNHLERLTVQEKRAIIRAFISEITVYGRQRDITINISASIPSMEILGKITTDICK